MVSGASCFFSAANAKRPSSPVPSKTRLVGSGVAIAASTLSIAKCGVLGAMSSILSNVTPLKVIDPWGYWKPARIVPVATTLPTGTPPSNAARANGPVPSVAKSIEMLVRLELKAMSKAMFETGCRPGSYRMFPLKGGAKKGTRATANPPGKAGLLNVAVKPLLVFENIVEGPQKSEPTGSELELKNRISTRYPRGPKQEHQQKKNSRIAKSHQICPQNSNRI
jgi:hypothetical protein